MNFISPKSSIYGNVKIGDNVRIDDFAILTGDIEIGDNVHIGCFCFLSGGKGIVLEDFSGLSPRTSIFTASDDYLGYSLTNPTIPDQFKPELHSGPVLLKRHVIVGAHSVIMPNLTIGEGSAVGAFSFVDDDLEPWGVYTGRPAIKIKRRSNNLLAIEKEFLEWQQPKRSLTRPFGRSGIATRPRQTGRRHWKTSTTCSAHGARSTLITIP